MNANTQLTFYGQEKVDYNAQLCMMNMAVHGLNANIKSGEDANTFYNDAWHIAGKCDYIFANPPFNVDKVKAVECEAAGRLPFGLPGVNKKTKEVSNANYLWISYFYSYLNDHGRAGFVMASSATDSSGRDRDIREQLVNTGCVDVLISVANNFFYTLSLPCTLWAFNRAKKEDIKDKVLFIDARNYYTVVDRTLNEWSDWQLRNLQAIVHLYRGEKDRYKKLIKDYWQEIGAFVESHDCAGFHDPSLGDTENPNFKGILSKFEAYADTLKSEIKKLQSKLKETKVRSEKNGIKETIRGNETLLDETEEIIETTKEAIWLTDKFGLDGDYQDVAGLCKIATIEEIKEKNYSLTPGAYVGVAAQEDDGVDFNERMTEIHAELIKLNEEANVLMKEINENWEKMKGGEV